MCCWVVFGVIESMLIEWAGSKTGGNPDCEGAKPHWLKEKVFLCMGRIYVNMSRCPCPGESNYQQGGVKLRT